MALVLSSFTAVKLLLLKLDEKGSSGNACASFCSCCSFNTAVLSYVCVCVCVCVCVKGGGDRG